MKQQRKTYVAPAVKDDLTIEMEAQILQASNAEVDENFEKVETMGQEVGGTIGADQWTQEWK